MGKRGIQALPELVAKTHIDAKGIAKRIGCHYSTIYRWAAEGSDRPMPPSVTVFGRRLWRIADVEKFIADQLR